MTSLQKRTVNELLSVLDPLKCNRNTFKLSGRLKKTKQNHTKVPDVSGQLPQGVKHSVHSFHTAYHKQLFFHQIIVEGGQWCVRKETKKTRNWENNPERVLVLARSHFSAAVADYLWGSKQNPPLQIQKGYFFWKKKKKTRLKTKEIKATKLTVEILILSFTKMLPGCSYQKQTKVCKRLLCSAMYSS